MGHSFDLDTVAGLFQDGEPSVCNAEGDYYLQSSEFDDLDAAADVKARAEILLVRVNGIGRVLDPSYRPVELTGRFITPDGGSAVVLAVVAAEARIRAQSVGLVVNGEPVSPPPPRGPKYVALARNDTNVAEALAHIASGLDLVSLYKVYEVIRDDLGDLRAILDAGLASRNEISRFTAGANRPEASGPAARHARFSGDGPRNPMDQSEARRFTLDLVRRWMDTKLPSD